MNKFTKNISATISHIESGISMKAVTLGVAFGGVVIINLQTALSFLLHGLHGDMVAQQVMIEQWTNGISPLLASTEATNYIVKFPLYAISANLIPDPMLRLFLVTSLLNVLGWLGIWYFAYKIIALTGFVSQGAHAFLSLMLLFVAMISPFIFWINYPNSRNIELAFMIAILYFMLRLSGVFSAQKEFSLLQGILIGVASGIVYLNDPLSLYLVVAPFTLVAAIYFVIKKRPNFKKLIPYIAFLSVSLAVYFLLKTFVLSALITVPDKVSGVSVPQGEGVIFSLINIIKGLLFNMGIIWPDRIDGFTELLASLIAGTFVLLVWGTVVKSFTIKGITRDVAYQLLFVSLLITIVVFMSGYLAPYEDILFARYVAIVSLMVLIVAAISFGSLHRNLKIAGIVVVTLCVVAMGALIARNLYVNIEKFKNPEHFVHQKNDRIYKLISIAETYDVNKGYSSLQTAQPATYLSGGGLIMIPASCDKSNPQVPIQQASGWLIEIGSAFIPTKNSMIEVATRSSAFNPCSKDVVLRQIKDTPVAVVESGNDHTILVYDHDIRSQLYGPPKSYYSK